MAHPFLKWLGGKRQVMPHLLAHAPVAFGDYYEPFVGGGALFFALREAGRLPGRVVLSDANLRLVRTYRAVRDDVESVIFRLQSSACTYDASVYARVRAAFNAPREWPDVDVAVQFIYLNKTGFNGLYRENKSGTFNVPFGKFASPPTICDADNLRAASAALAGVEIVHQDFRCLLEAASGGRGAEAPAPGSLVYFDPPYVPLSATSDFTAYGAAGFGDEDQRDLHHVARVLRDRGVRVLLSNSSAEYVKALYTDFEQVTIPARRAVNSDATKRGAVTELVLR